MDTMAIEYPQTWNKINSKYTAQLIAVENNCNVGHFNIQPPSNFSFGLHLGVDFSLQQFTAPNKNTTELF